MTATARRIATAHPFPPRRTWPFFESPRPQAGFPSPATDYVERALDLNELLVTNPPATFFVRVQGDSMADSGILDGDLLAVDRSIDPKPGKIVVAAYDGELLVKRLRRLKGRLTLCSENATHPEYRPLPLDEAQECTLWGVVTGVIRKF